MIDMTSAILVKESSLVGTRCIDRMYTDFCYSYTSSRTISHLYIHQCSVQKLMFKADCVHEIFCVYTALLFKTLRR